MFDIRGIQVSGCNSEVLIFARLRFALMFNSLRTSALHSDFSHSLLSSPANFYRGNVHNNDSTKYLKKNLLVSVNVVHLSVQRSSNNYHIFSRCAYKYCDVSLVGHYA